MRSTQERIIGLDILRSSALIGVLVCHFVETSGDPSFLRNNTVFLLGQGGVELFFVLSGFLIGSILIRDITHEEKVFSVRKFWMARWFRTLPNYYFYLITAFILARPWKYPVHGFFLHFFFLQNLVSTSNSFFPPSWTLAVEEWFYLLFPLAIVSLRRIGLRPKICMLFCLLTFLILPRFFHFELTDYPDHHNGITGTVVYRLGSIAFGMMLAHIKAFMPALWKSLSSKYVVMIGLVALAATSMSLFKNDFAANHFSATQNILAYTAIDLSFFLMLPYLNTVKKIKAPVGTLVLWISLISYSLYLSHTQAMIFMGGILSKLGLEGIPFAVQQIIVFIAGAVTAILTYNFIEKPFLRLRKQVLNQPRQ